MWSLTGVTLYHTYSPALKELKPPLGSLSLDSPVRGEVCRGGWVRDIGGEAEEGGG